jgi:tetratricopeptide (TPR) repeat protein
MRDLRLADSLLNKENFLEALEQYMDLADEGERTQDKQLAGLANMGIAEVMRQSINPEEEIRFANKAISLLTDVEDILHSNAARWHLQSGYANLKEYYESLEEASRIIKTATVIKDTNTLAKSLEARINVYRTLLPDFSDSLLTCFRQLESLHRPISSPVYADMATLYHMMEKEDSSDYYMSLAEQGFHPLDSDIHILFEKYIIACDRNESNSEHILIALWNMQQLRYRHFMVNSAITTMNSISEKRIQVEESKNHLMRLRAIIIILFCLLGISFLSSAFIRHRKVSKLEKKHLSDALNAQVAALEELKETLQTKNMLSAQIEFGTLDTLCTEYYTGGNLSERRVAKAFEQMVLTYRNDPVFWNTFEQRVDEIHEGVISMMKKELTGFKTDDFRLMTYIVSGMSYFSISVLMGVDKPVLYNRAKRLRDRIRTSGAPDTYQFLNALSRNPTDISGPRD